MTLTFDLLTPGSMQILGAVARNEQGTCKRLEEEDDRRMRVGQYGMRRRWLGTTRSHPEVVGNMLHVTLNFDLSKLPCVFLARVKTYTHTKN